MDWIKAHSSVHLSPDEFSSMAASETAYWCAEALCNDSGAWRPEELAEKLRLEAKEVRIALEKLKKVGIAVRNAAGKYKCRYQGKFFTYPGRLEGMDKSFAKVKSYWNKPRRTAGPFSSVLNSSVRRKAPFPTTACSWHRLWMGPMPTPPTPVGILLVFF